MEKDNVYSLEYTIGSSHGTHIDAPSHFAVGKRNLLDIPQKERVLPLYVIHLEDKVKENPGYAVTVEDIQTFEAEYGEIPEDSFVALDRKSTRLNSSHVAISYAVFCLNNNKSRR